MTDGGKVGQEGVGAGRGGLSSHTHASDLFVAVACITVSSRHSLQNIQGSAHLTAWLGWAASQTPP